MGREVRRVIPNWEHPRYTRETAPYNSLRSVVGEFIPLHDRSYSEAKREWLDGLAKWEAGERPEWETQSQDFWQYAGDPPQREHYRPDWSDADATWYQLYGTVSEGTPLSPPFATLEELAEWLSTNRDYWGKGPVSRETADRFVAVGWVPSGIIVGGGPMVTGLDAVNLLNPPE